MRLSLSPSYTKFVTERGEVVCGHMCHIIKLLLTILLSVFPTLYILTHLSDARKHPGVLERRSIIDTYIYSQILPERIGKADNMRIKGKFILHYLLFTAYFSLSENPRDHTNFQKFSGCKQNSSRPHFCLTFFLKNRGLHDF